MADEESTEDIDNIVEDAIGDMAEGDEESKKVEGEEEAIPDVDVASIISGDEEEEEEQDENEEIPEGLTDKAKESFIAQRLEIKRLKEVAKASKDPEEDPDGWKGKYEKTQARLAQVDLASTDSFKSEFDGPIAQRVQSMIALVGKEHASVLRNALSQAPRQRLSTFQEHFSDLAPTLLTMSVDVDSIASSRRQALDKAAETAKNLQAKGKQQTQQEAKQGLDSLKSEGVVFVQSKNAPDWNKEYLGMIDSDLEGILSGSLPTSEVQARAAAFSATNKLVSDLAEKNSALSKQIAKLTGKKPKVNVSGRDVGKAKAKGKDAESVDDIVDDVLSDM